MKKCLWLAAVVTTALLVTAARAQVKVETVLDGLDKTKVDLVDLIVCLIQGGFRWRCNRRFRI